MLHCLSATVGYTTSLFNLTGGSFVLMFICVLLEKDNVNADKSKTLPLLTGGGFGLT